MTDTYYVVVHQSYLISVIVAFAVLWALWWAIFRLGPPLPRLRAATLASFVTGLALTLLPLIWQGDVLALARVTTLGGLAAQAAGFLTVVVLVWRVFAALLDRL